MRTAARLCFLCLAVTLVWPDTSLGGHPKLPEWARAMARLPAPREHESDEFDYRVLLAETRVTVKSNGKLKIHRRIARQVLRDDPRTGGEHSFYVNDNMTVQEARGWEFTRNREVRESSKARMTLVADWDSFLTGSTVRIVRLEDVEKDSLVFFEFEATEDLDLLTDAFYLYEPVPADRIRLEIELPEGWQLRYDWPRGAVAPTVRDGNTSNWEIKNWQPPVVEPLGESPGESAPMIVLAFIPPPGSEVSVPSAPDWTAFGSWYDQLVKGRLVATPALESMASEVFEGTSGFFDRVQSAGNYVRDSVRYVAKSIGVGRYVPRPASEVLGNLYGDCKDKGTLLIALLATMEIETHPILVHASSRLTVSELVPAQSSFNHFIVGVPVPDDEPIPAAYEAAVVEAGELGRLLIVDTTNEFAAIGSIPAYLGGKQALVVAGDRSRLLTLPGETPEAHRVEWHMEVEAEEDVSLTIRLQVSRYGEPATMARAAYRRSSREYHESLRRRMLATFPSATIAEQAVESEAGQGSFIESLVLKMPAESSASLPLFPAAIDILPRVSLNRRQGPVIYDHPLSLRFESVFTGVPDELSPPGAQNLEGNGWSLRTESERSETSVRCLLEFSLSRTRFEPDDFPELRGIWSALRRATSPSITISGSDSTGSP